MSSARDWIFRQLGPPNKVMTLSGWSAPFGRQRKGPVVTDEMTIREKTTYYPGTDAPPTRHIFGVKYEPFELSGRWMDQVGGVDYAKNQTDYVKAFVRDQQPVAISWGPILAVNGFIDKFTPARESEQQVAWKLHILIDEDQNANAAPIQTLIAGPKAYIQDLASLGIVTTRAKAGPLGPYFKPSFLEGLDNLVSSVNSAIANLVTVATSIDSFEKAVVGDIKRLRAGIGQVRTAALILRGTIASAQTNGLLPSRSSGTDIRSLSYVAQADVNLIRVLGLLAELDRRSEIAERGKAFTSYVAQLGDTWESISTRYSGGPDKAQKLRDINAVRYGAAPVPGTSYKVPLT